MSPNIRPLIAGNWKMNGLGPDLTEVRALAEALRTEPAAVRVALCPPFTLLSRMADALAGSAVAVGAQDVHARASGAFTGDISAAMLADAGAALVILGHSERRTLHGETDADVAAKVEAALAGALEPIVCVGETLQERQDGHADTVVRDQLLGSLPESLRGQVFAIAYEPVWAIGSGRTPSPAEIVSIHALIRAVLVQRFGETGARAPILYGGSVKPGNAAEILALPEVGGALVGGASLKAADFLPIVRAG